jgi:hypothetical protein
MFCSKCSVDVPKLCKGMCGRCYALDYREKNREKLRLYKFTYDSYKKEETYGVKTCYVCGVDVRSFHRGSLCLPCSRKIDSVINGLGFDKNRFYKSMFANTNDYREFIFKVMNTNKDTRDDFEDTNLFAKVVRDNTIVSKKAIIQTKNRQIVVYEKIVCPRCQQESTNNHRSGICYKCYRHEHYMKHRTSKVSKTKVVSSSLKI